MAANMAVNTTKIGQHWILTRVIKMKCKKRILTTLLVGSLFCSGTFAQATGVLPVTAFNTPTTFINFVEDITKAADQCFLLDLGCMFDDVKKLNEAELCQDYGFKQTSHHAPAYTPEWGYTFINPNNPKQIVLAFRLDRAARDYLNENDRFTIDIDMVTHNYLAKAIGLKEIRHNLPTDALATNDTYFSDTLSYPTKTLFIDNPQALVAGENYYVIFEYNARIDWFKHSFNWQLGYDTNIFDETGRSLHYALMQKHISDNALFLYKALLVEGYVTYQRDECETNNTMEACESFALDTDPYTKFADENFIGWKKKRFSKDLFHPDDSESLKALYQKLMATLTQTAKEKAVNVITAPVNFQANTATKM
jgi:hypothetical protein